MQSKVTVFPTRPRLFRLLIYFALFASGASSLISEITWYRMLIVVVGNSLSATAMIIGVFMTGLGLGSHVGGRAFGSRRSGLLPYLVLEIAIGVYIVLSPVIFDGFAQAFPALAVGFPSRSLLSFFRILVSLAALLLPAALMGATYPAMMAGAWADAPVSRAGRAGFLYGVNTLGGAIGCFVGGYHLIFEYGVRVTLLYAFGLNLAAVAFALIATRAAPRMSGQAETAAAVSESVQGGDEARVRRFLMIAVFVTGFVSLAYEVSLTRMVILFLNNEASTFALVLTGFLLGTGAGALLGTWAYRSLARRMRRGDILLGGTAFAAGTLILLAPYYILSSAEYPLQSLLAIIVPTVPIGAFLPISIQMLHSAGRGGTTRGAATLYALNTAGGILGASIINNILIPRIGLQGGLLLLATLCATIGVVSLLPAGWSRLRRTVAAAAVLVSVGILAVALPNMMNLYTGKIAEWSRAPSAAVRFTQEGRVSNVAVLDLSDRNRIWFRDMYLNGIEEVSTRFYHTQLFKLLGILPVMLHTPDAPRDTLVIAFGAGITAGSVLADERVQSLDVVDINPDIDRINELFNEVNGDVIHQPRFHFHNDDGRNFLVTSGKRYDVIIVDSTHPCAYDSWILYTREFYDLVKKRLLPGGVFAQWLPVNAKLRGDLFRIQLNTFLHAFPNATFWYIYGSDQAFMLATPAPFSLDTLQLKSRLARLPAWFKAGDYQIDTVARLSGFFWLDDRAMAELIGSETRINTDNHHYFEDMAALRPSPPASQLPRFQSDIQPFLAHADPVLRSAARQEQLLAGMVAAYSYDNDKDQLFLAYRVRPDNGNVRYWMSLRFPDRMKD